MCDKTLVLMVKISIIKISIGIALINFRLTVMIA